MDNKDNELAKLSGNEGFVSMDRILELQAEAKSRAAGAASGGADNNESSDLAGQSQATLEDSEQYRLQMAAISTAALGYWTEDEGIKPEYNTPALRDVAKLYAKYAALHESQATKVQAVPADWLLRSLVADLLHLLPVTFEFAELDRATGEAVVAKLRAMLANPTAQEVTLLTYWKAQRAMIERTIIGLRDGWATRKDAADALVTLAAATPVSEEVTQQAAKAETAEQADILAAAQQRMWEALDRRACPAPWMQIASDAIFGFKKDSFGSNLAPTTSTATASGSAQPESLWQHIDTLPYADDLVWLRRGDSIEGPRVMTTDDYDRFEEWAPCEPPSQSASAQASQAAASDEVREKVRDAVAVALDGVYICWRVWSAWGYGTMSQNDFAPVGEDDDVLDSVVSAVFAALRTNPATPASKGGA